MPQRLKAELGRLLRDIRYCHRLGLSLIALGAVLGLLAAFFWSVLLLGGGAIAIVAGAVVYEIAEEMEIIYHQIEERMKQI